MNLANTFKISLYAQTALAGWILGAAEEGWIPYGSLPAVILGFMWSESPRHGNRARGMNDAFASICGFIALCFATSEFFSENIEGRLLSGTHLVVYLTWIVLLQTKTDRRYWLLLALGALQLAVASVLTTGRATIWFGLSAILYIVVTTWTMSVFSLYRSATRLDPALPVPTDQPLPEEFQHRSMSIGSVQLENGLHWITAPFISGVLFTSTAGLFVSALFFLLIPRVWIPAAGALGADDTSSPAISRTMFAPDVRLGDMGPILESLDPVLQLRLRNPDRSPLHPQVYAERLGLAEPLFRVVVLSIYEGPRWKVDSLATMRPQRLLPSGNQPMVRQEIRLEDIGTDALPCLGTPLVLVDQEEQPRGSFQLLTGLIYRGPDLTKGGTVRYSVYSEMPPREPLAHARSRISPLIQSQYETSGYFHRNMQVPLSLKRTAELAREIVNRERARRGTDLSQLEAASAIESYLRDSGDYSYSLNLSIDDPSIDPVEDFLFNRKQGHCEYFASALVLMLRSIGIPSRLITGYKGGNYDAPSNTLHVQQRHAHAWCEAWIDKGWVTLDATPADERSASVEAVSANRSVWSDVRTQLAGIWSENVVNISLDKQEEVFYRPIRQFVLSIGNTLRELWKSPQETLAGFFRLLIDPRRWFSLRGAGALFVVGGTTWLVQRLIRKLRWRQWRLPQVDSTGHRIVEFYERFARLMQSLNLQRAETQTQHEFALEAAMLLHPRLQAIDLVSGPGEIADLFYKVRFGDQTLPESEIARVDALLSGMERVLQADRVDSNRPAAPQRG